MQARVVLLMMLVMWTMPALAQTTGQELRRDKQFGTFHEGMQVESGPGKDTVITVTPPPPSQREGGQNQSQSPPLVIVPEVHVTPRPHLPRQ